MPQDLDYGDTQHAGIHTFEKTPVIPAGSWGDPQIGTLNPIDVPKLKHQYDQVYGQLHGVAAVSERKVIHVARAAGVAQAIEAGVVVAALGGATVTIDLRKNGTTILSSVITINNTHAAYQKVAGVISTSAYVLGDVFELVTVATVGGGTLPQALFVDSIFREGAGS